MAPLQYIICRNISIHAPREGGDAGTRSAPSGLRNFNPRPPRGGRLAALKEWVNDYFISIHAPREGGDEQAGIFGIMFDISIHAPREGGDGLRVIRIKKSQDFNPRPPRGGRLFSAVLSPPTSSISIHAPREGGDFTLVLGHATINNFNPRPPRGGRHRNCVMC